MGSNTIQIIESMDVDDTAAGSATNAEGGRSNSSSSIDVIIIATHYPHLFDDPYINDWVRRTNSIIHMSTDVCNDYGYYQRVNEGADIILW